MTKELLLDKNMTELQEFVQATGQPGYRARQLLDWLYCKQAMSYHELTNLPQAWRIDVVAVEMDKKGKPSRIELIENAVGEE